MTGIRTIRIIRRMACALAGLAAAVLASVTVASSAFAMEVPAPPDSGARVGAVPHIHTVTTGGMPGWQITLIALASAVLAAALAVTVEHVLAARRRVTAHAA